ncbi:MAG: hypothetical protein KAV87_31445, partial [Desulfobacteraceae bacterium]|nr:hypothetical protein [Desulfobacteraceae bacterium]
FESPQFSYSSETQRFLVRFEVLRGYMEPKRSDCTATVLPQAAFSECCPAFDVLSFRCSTDQTGNPMVIYHTTETIRWGRI